VNAIERRIEQVVTNNKKGGVIGGIGLMPAVERKRLPATRQAADSADPAMNADLQLVVSSWFAEPGGKGRDGRFDNLCIRSLAPGYGCFAAEQPAEDAMVFGRIPSGLIVETAAVEVFEHAVSVIPAASPESLIEQDRDTQVVGRMIVMGNVPLHGSVQAIALEMEMFEGLNREGEDNRIEGSLRSPSCRLCLDGQSAISSTAH
jgi:hypothetical protein